MCSMCSGLADHVVENDVGTAIDKRFVFLVPDMVCGACVAKIEKAVSGLPYVCNARANLTLKRLVVEGDEHLTKGRVLERLKGLSFTAFEIDQSSLEDNEESKQTKALLRALAVAGFGAANIMLLSVSAWSGAVDTTRDLFHLISAFVAVPVVAYSGQPFFRSAWQAVRSGHVNMDVPISLAVLLALGMSIFQTMASKPEAYFDAAVMLLFFLLIGRYLDRSMRSRARSAVISLSQYAAQDAVEVLSSGETRLVKTKEITPKMVLRLFAGSRVPTDCTIISGSTDIDRSMVTGESEPVALEKGAFLEAGTLNLTGVVDVLVERPASRSFLAEITRMLEAAEQGKSRYVRIADRMARIYTPAVHFFALIAFAGWMFFSQGDWEKSLIVAISVLIVTCPCALGLAVPVAHVVAASRLFKNGLLMRDGSALERLAETNIAVFDKTGTLTNGLKQIERVVGLDQIHTQVLATLAAHSVHPNAMGICTYLGPVESIDLSEVREHPGQGISALWQEYEIRLGKYNWVAEISDIHATETMQSATAFAVAGFPMVLFFYKETARLFAKEVLETLSKDGIKSIMLTGDNWEAAERIADSFSFDTIYAEQTPEMKLACIRDLVNKAGMKPLMIGDGINDAPALAAAHVSIAPSNAADVGRQAADFVLTRGDLNAVSFARHLSMRTNIIVRQNFLLALLYNCIAVPLALFGFVTPLIAAIAMSASSIIVISNSLRLLHDK